MSAAQAAEEALLVPLQILKSAPQIRKIEWAVGLRGQSRGTGHCVVKCAA